jgi:hypothetical protein
MDANQNQRRPQPNYDILKQYNPNQPMGKCPIGFANINYLPMPQQSLANTALIQLMNKNIQLARQNSVASIRSEQDILDNGFLDLFETKKEADSIGKRASYELSPPSRPLPPLPPVNGDLIDLDVDRQKSANILDLFDPLTERLNQQARVDAPLLPAAIVIDSEKVDDVEVKKILELPAIRLKKRNSLNLEENGLSRDSATRIARKGCLLISIPCI